MEPLKNILDFFLVMEDSKVQITEISSVVIMPALATKHGHD